MEILNELLVIVVIGGLISVGAYDALKSFIKYLLQKHEEDQWNKDPEEDFAKDDDDFLDEIHDDVDDIIDDVHDDVDDILDDAEEIVDDTARGILKPVIGAVKLVSKIAKKVAKLITFWRK